MKTSRLWLALPAHPLMHEPGFYLEDGKNEYDTSIYYPMRFMKAWYAKREIAHAKTWLFRQQRQESVNVQQGLHFSGENAFERELKRKGVQVEKYPLPSTVATKRVHEMVLLRRRKIEEMAATKMDEARTKIRLDRPSAWYDETDGPLNQHFLRMVQPAYNQVITELPEMPIRHVPITTRPAKHAQDAEVEPV
jgi:hypothetical protein